MNERERIAALEREIELLKQVLDLKEKIAAYESVYPSYPKWYLSTPADPWSPTIRTTFTGASVSTSDGTVTGGNNG